MIYGLWFPKSEFHVLPAAALGHGFLGPHRHRLHLLVVVDDDVVLLLLLLLFFDGCATCVCFGFLLFLERESAFRERKSSKKRTCFV